MSRAARPQGVTPLLEDRVPEARRVFRRAAELTAALAGVPGAADEAVDAEHLEPAVGERRELDPEPVECLGALDGEERPLVGHVLRLVERRVVGLDVRCVHDEQVAGRLRGGTRSGRP